MGEAHYDEHGKPQASAVLVIWSKVEACPPEDDEGCARVGNGGLSEEAAGAVKPGKILRDAGWSLLKWGAGLLF